MQAWLGLFFSEAQEHLYTLFSCDNDMTMITLFTRQRTSTFNLATREVVWCQEEGYTWTSVYGTHMYELQVEIPEEEMEYLFSEDVPPEGYTFGVENSDWGYTWYSISTSLIVSCKYIGEMCTLPLLPQDKLKVFQDESITKLRGLKQVSQTVFTFKLDGVVEIDFESKTITPEEWDEDEWEDNIKFIKYLEKKLFS